jgi:hypothetical protein
MPGARQVVAVFASPQLEASRRLPNPHEGMAVGRSDRCWIFETWSDQGESNATHRTLEGSGLNPSAWTH